MLLSLLICSGCKTTSTPPASSTPAESKALLQTRSETLYRTVWEMVQQEYYDASFNGQNWLNWKNHFSGQIHDLDDAKVAIDTMLASLNDQYTRYLPPREMREQTMHIDSKLFGVGIQISTKENKLVVVAPLPDTPAAKAGIQVGDIITHIDHHPTAGMSVENAADRIRGEKGSTVCLSVQRKSKNFDVFLTRAEIRIKSVFSKALSDPTVGYIQLTSFISETAINELRDELEKMRNKKGLIIDLRANYGGLLSNAVEMSDLFLNKGVIVSIVDRFQERRSYKAETGEISKQPLVILINGGSASASEIVSGALKDHHRATLIGTTSFGKGLVQKINPLPENAGLNITISRYLTPNGTDINKKGIAPDITVPLNEDDFKHNRDTQLNAAVTFLKH